MSAHILTQEDFKQYMSAYIAQVDAWLYAYFIEQGNATSAIPDGLREGMEYSIFAGGKRLRPVLCMASAALCGMDSQEMARIVPFAGALEMVHTYSLIHDDLPAMDNDALRRGKPTNHIRFGEANAVLAGDALLTDAFAVMASVSLPPERILPAIARFAWAAGSGGMVGGQFLDMLHEGKGDTPLPALQHIHALKTGAVITGACVCGGLLAGADTDAMKALEAYGASLGVAFQIQDDILDVTSTAEALGKTPGKDVASGKLTYPALMGLSASQALAEEHACRAIDSLAAFSGRDAALLRALAQYAVMRKN